MARCFSAKAVLSFRKPQSHQTAKWLAAALMLVVTVRVGAHAQSTNSPAKSAAKPCADVDLAGGNDTEALKAFGVQLRQLFSQEEFKQLDCIADAERANKTRLPGGMWKLHEFYWALTGKQGHPTQEDLQNQLKLAEDWVAAQPTSITAPVVLAKSYINYAWDARGTDTGDTVTGSGWKLFGQRLEKAQAVLDAASGLHSRCPEWYLTMQDIALGRGWDLPTSTDLLKQATAFEPAYYYYYRSMAYSLMPQWNGEDGEASKFAEDSANHVGGDAGDILYFQIGEKIVCACNQPEFAHLSWPRLQKGYGLLEKKYGVSVANLNKLAVMATKSGDWATADGAFQRIGDDWDKDAWITETFFKQMKGMASQVGEAEARTRAILKEAATNSQSEGGAAYQKRMEQALLPFLRKCVQESTDQTKFEFAIKVGKDGSAQDAFFRQPTPLAQCMSREMYGTHVTKETPFPVPPRPDYWLELYLDPAAANAAAAN